VVIVKVAWFAPAGIWTVAGAANEDLLLATTTLAPDEVALVIATVQVLAALAPSVEGAHEREASCDAPVTVIVKACVLPRVAASITL
jgi:hypothetical protein